MVKPFPASDLSNSRGKYESGDFYIYYLMFCWRFVYFFNVDIIFLLRLILKFTSVVDLFFVVCYLSSDVLGLFFKRCSMFNIIGNILLWKYI